MIREINPTQKNKYNMFFVYLDSKKNTTDQREGTEEEVVMK